VWVCKGHRFDLSQWCASEDDVAAALTTYLPLHAPALLLCSFWLAQQWMHVGSMAGSSIARMQIVSHEY
jgi:hypothetical protein